MHPVYLTSLIICNSLTNLCIKSCLINERILFRDGDKAITAVSP